MFVLRVTEGSKVMWPLCIWVQARVNVVYFTQEQADTTKAIIIKSKQFPFIRKLIFLFHQEELTNQSNPKKVHTISPDNLFMNTHLMRYYPSISMQKKKTSLDSKL